MLLNDICEGLKGLGLPINIYAEKNRIYLNGHKNYNEYLSFDDEGHISLKVFPKDKQPGQKFSPQEYLLNKARKDELIETINGLNLGFILNKDGEKV